MTSYKKSQNSLIPFIQVPQMFTLYHTALFFPFSFLLFLFSMCVYNKK